MPIDPRDKGHKDPEKIDLSVPRRAQYLHSAWKKHQDAVYWVDIDLAIRKGFTFYQTRSNAIILQGTLPAYCIPKVVRLKTGEVLYEKVYMSPRPPPKISLRHDWARGEVPLGSTVEQQPEGKVVRQSRGEVQHAKFSKPTQPKPKPICDRSAKPKDTEDVFVVKGETSRSHEIDEKGLHEELRSSCSVCELIGNWLSCLVFTRLCDAVEGSTSGVLSLHRETKFIIGFDFAVTLSSPESFCVLFAIASEQTVELKWQILNKHNK